MDSKLRGRPSGTWTRVRPKFGSGRRWVRNWRAGFAPWLTTESDWTANWDDYEFDIESAELPETPAGRLPTSAAARKALPVATGCLDYFPDALLAVAELSRIGNEQHNPGQPLHWDRSKSQDEADALLRHLIDRGTIDTDGVRHSAKVAWRALALLQKEIEAARKEVPEYTAGSTLAGSVDYQEPA